MRTAAMMERVRETSPRFKARIAGVFYLLSILTEAFWLLIGGKLGLAAKLIATASYIPVTLLFYDLFKPVNRSLSLLAASVSLVGIVLGVLILFHLASFPISPLIFFAFYFLLIGYLIFRSTFLPRILGALMAFGGLVLLIFLSPPLAKFLFPYHLAPVMVGGGVLTLWLLVVGVNAERWKEKAKLIGR